jgi:Rv0078B-related antitoxin
MNPTDALQRQIARYRQMTGEERVALACELHELSCDIARQSIRDRWPEADREEVERRLRQRLSLTHAP